MAILQQPNAVFYHPLDDSIESLESQAWIGSPPFTTAKVGLGMSPATMSQSFGAESKHLTAITLSNRIAVLSATKFVVMFTNTPGNVLAKVGTVSGTDITYGGLVVITASASLATHAIVAIDSTHVVVAYRILTGDSPLQVGTVSGTDITFGAAASLGAGTVPWGIAALSSTKVVVSFATAAFSGSLVGTVSGTDITVASSTSFDGTATGPGVWIGTDALSASKFVVTWTDSGGNGQSKVGDVAGTTVSFGTATAFSTAPNSLGPSVAALSSTKFVVAYNEVAVKVGVVSGLNITYGSEAVVTTGSVGNEMRVAKIGSSAVWVAYRDGADSDHGTAKIGAVSGTNITFGAETEFLSTDPTLNIDVGVSGGTGIVVYNPSGGLNHGSAKAAAFVSTVSTTLWFGAESEFLALPALWNAVVALSATKIVVAYQSDGGASFVRVGTVSGTDVTFGAEELFENTLTSHISLAALSATKFVVAWLATADRGRVTVGVVSGTTITIASESQFSASVEAVAPVVALSATSIVLAWRAGPNNGKSVIGTVIGLAISTGVEEEFSSSDIGLQLSLTALSATAVVVAYEDIGDSSHGTAKIGIITGSSISFGAESEFLSVVGGVLWISVAALSATKFIVAYSDGADSNHGTAKVGTVAGMDITFGAETEFLSTGQASYTIATAVDATRFVITYRDLPGSDHGTAKVGTVSGTDITFDAESEFFGTGAAAYIAAALLDTDKIVVAYADAPDGDGGKVKIGTLPSDASLIASTPAAYPTVIGGEHVTFAAWTRSLGPSK